MKKVYLMAVIAALIAGIAAYSFTKSIQERTSIENAPTKEVLVVAADITSGSTITVEMAETSFTKKVVLQEDAIPDAITDLEEIIGRVATQALFAGEQVNGKAFMQEGGDDANLSFNLAEGEAAYSIQAEAEKGVDGYIVPGDTINIIAHYENENRIENPVDKGKDEKDEGLITVLQFEDVEVLKVATYQEVVAAKGEAGDGEVKTYVSLTLRTTKEQAVELFHMEQSSKEYKIVLNSHIDTENLLGE